MPAIALLRRVGLAVAVAGCVVAGGLVASGGSDEATAPAAPVPTVAVRANVDPLSALTGGADQLAQLQGVVEQRPKDAQANARLGLAYLQRARETYDPSYYGKADELLDRAKALEPNNLDATLGLGSLALSRHDFEDALALGHNALTLSKGFSPGASAIVGDAQIELGRYDEAFRTMDALGQLHPSLVAWARQSYAAELRGDLEAATGYMRQAVESGAGGGEATQWTRVQFAALLLKQGRIDAAEREYHHALAALPTYARAQAGLGAVALARGDLAEAELQYQAAADRIPLPEILIALGDVQAARGEATAAKASYDLVRAEQQLFQQAGGNADLELAVFEANHGDPARAVALARKAVADRPSVFAHDALGWALFKSGDCGAALSEARAATRLRSADQTLAYHHGAIAACAGRLAEARAALERSLAGNPRFNAVDGPAARTVLDNLKDQA